MQKISYTYTSNKENLTPNELLGQEVVGRINTVHNYIVQAHDRLFGANAQSPTVIPNQVLGSEVQFQDMTAEADTVNLTTTPPEVVKQQLASSNTGTGAAVDYTRAPQIMNALRMVDDAHNNVAGGDSNA